MLMLKVYYLLFLILRFLVHFILEKCIRRTSYELSLQAYITKTVFVHTINVKNYHNILLQNVHLLFFKNITIRYIRNLHNIMVYILTYCTVYCIDIY